MRSFSALLGLMALVSIAARAQNQPPAPASVPATAVPAPGQAAPAPAQTRAPAPAWRPFQEFAFLEGSWSGSAESGARVGGRVARFTPEFSGNYVVHRGSTVLTADDGTAETIEEVGYFAYDREKRRYVASYFFSTGISAVFDVEVLPDGVRLLSRELLNAEVGTRARILVSRKADGEIALSTELAPPGKDFAPWLVSALKKK